METVGFISVAITLFYMLHGERMINARHSMKIYLGSREPVNNHLPNCVLLKNLNNGSEDITVFGDGLALISSGLKYPGLPSSDVPGKIFFLNLKKSDMEPMELPISGKLDLETFNPHGISVYTSPANGTVYLFVVNHPQHKSQVELFKFDEAGLSLLHLNTFKHRLLHSVNNIVAVGVDRFYATNDHHFPDELLKTTVEPLLGQPLTNVVYYSTEEVKVVSEGYYMANGINISPDQRHIYVADILDHKVHVLERKTDNALVSVKSVSVGSFCDNIEVDPKTGDLWLGSLPNIWKMFQFDPKNPPGSEVIRIQNILSEEPVVTQVYADDGHVIMGSSVATVYGRKLLIGTVFHKTLCCDLD
ncbi:serum paraoxonase/arylesterase 2-like [Corythoichthys intestinalis]|uniref:serum paraoxonase/arylesterase 2-like n=1 Tax=Corythoichthys intestinalis TaxID=161448 RepID=UPI0025A53DD9|nr:serum paraoxonase/arylesterase 2-like [Corythoichthys intestinalis]XP_061789715.1 serum paraoxonase/arylesterase 2-like [Nerophis lumbriciformis]